MNVVNLVIAAMLFGQTNYAEQVKKSGKDLTPRVAFIFAGDQLMSANTLGPGHFKVGINGNLQKIEFASPADTTKNIKFFMPLPYLSVQLGIFKGFSFTPLIGGVGSLEIFARYTNISALTKLADEVEKMGDYYAIGTKLGIFKEKLWMPAVSLIANYSGISTIKVKAVSVNDTVETHSKINAFSLSLAVSKNFLVITPYASLGYVKGSISSSYRVSSLSSEFKKVDIKAKGLIKTTLGAELSLFPLVKGYGEISFASRYTMLSAGFKIGL